VKIHLYLDIDGVLNAYERHALPGFHSQWPGGYERNGYEHVAPIMVNRLNNMISTYGIRAHWLTTWMDGAVGFGQHFGLEGSSTWPILDAIHGNGDEWAKFTSIKAHVEETKPDLAFWFDDDLATEPEAMRWAFSVPGMAAFAPEGVHGITPGMLRAVERMIREAGR
jgi:hypothetical protein